MQNVTTYHRRAEHHAPPINSLHTSHQRTLNTSAHCTLVLELLWETQHGQALDGRMLNLHGEKTEQDQQQ